ncbi:cache domain-containing protein [Dongia sp.]|uniref:PDC sensor domain-containing protein n=1 Tax=Dongia sp. TaxID=1977262 RepID=UPI0035AEB419
MSTQGTIQQRPEPGGISIGPRTMMAVLIVALAAGSSYWLLSEAALVPASVPQESIDAAVQDVVGFVQPSIDAAIDLGRLVELAKEAGSERDIVRGIAVPTLQMSSENIGVAVAFEPNGFDGKDAQYAGVGQENDEQGRFVAYYYTARDGDVLTDRLIMTAEAGIESWYVEPLRSKRPHLLPPYIYPIDGTDTLLATISIPLLSNGKGFGLATLDVSLARLQSTLRASKPGETGMVALLGSEGSWIAHPDTTYVGKEISETDTARAGPFDNREAAIAYASSAAGNTETGSAHTVEATGERYLVAPVAFDGVPESWTLIVRLPPAGITPELKQALLMTLGITLISALGLAILSITYRGRASVSRQGLPSVALPAKARRTQSTIERR